jgi:D-xylose transport system substrate-binding protein
MRKNGMRRASLAAVPVVALAVLASACGGSSSSSSSSSSAATSAPAASSAAGGAGGTIALLLPETKTTRYESADKPYFVAKLKALCPSCKLIEENAGGDASKQQSQADSAMTNGAKVLVLDAVDSASAGAIATKAHGQGVKVVSYDRLITGSSGVDAYISFDNEQVGKLQAQALIDQLKKTGKTGPIVQINGAPTDNNAKLFKKGAHDVLDTSGFKIAKEYDTPDWSPDNAQKEMDQAITALGKTGFVGVYAANDGTAGGAIAAMKRDGVDPKQIPTTGQDAETAGLQRIVTGEQFMTVYKAIKPQAEQAAQLAVDLLQGKPLTGVNQQIDNGSTKVPSIILTPVAVTKDNIETTVVKDGFVKAADLCAGAAASACTTLGIK